MADYGLMKWKISDVPLDKSVLDTFPELQSIFAGLNFEKKFGKRAVLDYDKAIRYVIYTYHRQSPLIQVISDVIKRKVHVMEMLGIKKGESGRFSKAIEEIIYSRNELIAHLTIHFLKYENDRLWAKYCVNCELYWRAMHLIMKEGELKQDDKKKTVDDVLKTQLENKKKLIDIEKDMMAQEQILFEDKPLTDFAASYMEEEKRTVIFPEDLVYNSKLEQPNEVQL
jgi:hypothetical protein